MGKKWIRIKEIGQLYLEKVIVSFDIPILFVCNDFENRKYLCLNINDELGTTVLAETDNKSLIGMLKNEVTMESVFRGAIGNRVIIAEYDNGEIVTRTESAKNISEDVLPEKGAFLDFSDEAITNYISFLNKQVIKVEIEDFFARETITVQVIKNCVYFAAQNETIVSCGNIRPEDTKEECSYEISRNKKLIA